MSLSTIILLAILLLLIITVIEATIIVYRQKKYMAFQQNESNISKEFRDRLGDNLSQSRLDNDKFAEMVKNNTESVNSNFCKILSQLKVISTELHEQIERINPGYTTDRLEGFCGQIMNRGISLEEKIYELKRINEQVAVDCRCQKNLPSAASSEVKVQTDQPSPENFKHPCKGELIADFVKTLDPG